MKKEKDLSIREVILTNRDFFQALQSCAQNMIAGEKEKMFQRRLILPLEYSDFQDIFQSFGNACLYSRNQNRNFVIDNDNEPIIEQLYLYATNNPAFDGDLDKGIMLQGKFGCGKTILLETYSLLHNHVIKMFFLNRPLLMFTKSVELQEQIMKQSVKMFILRPIVIDEFGRESKMIQDYGNIMRPISELLSLRSDAGALTHGTTNFTLETLSSEDFYGRMIGDRLRVMFNFITLKGESRRV
jgi:DNA replication protein DnaC